MERYYHYCRYCDRLLHRLRIIFADSSFLPRRGGSLGTVPGPGSLVAMSCQLASPATLQTTVLFSYLHRLNAEEPQGL